jgi:hypothetical protein
MSNTGLCMLRIFPSYESLCGAGFGGYLYSLLHAKITAQNSGLTEKP